MTNIDDSEEFYASYSDEQLCDLIGNDMITARAVMQNYPRKTITRPLQEHLIKMLNVRDDTYVALKAFMLGEIDADMAKIIVSKPGISMMEAIKAPIMTAEAAKIMLTVFNGQTSCARIVLNLHVSSKKKGVDKVRELFNSVVDDEELLHRFLKGMNGHYCTYRDLLLQLTTHPSEKIRVQVAESCDFYAVKDSESFSILEKDKAGSVRGAYAYNLGHFVSTSLNDYEDDYRGEHSMHVEHTAETIIEAFTEKYTTATSAYFRVLRDPSPYVRRRLLEGWQRGHNSLHGISAAPFIEPFAEDDDPRVRETLVKNCYGFTPYMFEALTAAGNSSVLKLAVMEQMNSILYNPRRRSRLADVFVNVLTRLSGDPDPDVAVTANNTLLNMLS